MGKTSFTIADCFSFIRNGANIKQDKEKRGYPITRIETTSNSIFNRDKVGYAGIEDITPYQDYVLEDGDLLMSHINSLPYLGRVVYYDRKQNEVIIHGMNLLRLKAIRTRLRPRYATFLFSAIRFKNKIYAIAKKSVNQASFSINDLKKIIIELPTVEQQDHIVNKLVGIQKIIKLRQSQLAKLDELVKCRFVEMFGDPTLNPFNWKIVPLSSIIRGNASNGYFAKKEEYCQLGNVQVLGVANVVNRMYSSTYNLPRAKATDKDIKKYHIKYGDMLFCRSSLVAEGIGKASIVPPNIPKNTLFECHVIRISLDLSQCVPEYIQVLSTDFYFRKQVIAQSKTATMTTISQDGILKCCVPLTPLELQKEFLTFTHRIDKLRFDIQKSLNETQKLFDSLMQEYFD